MKPTVTAKSMILIAATLSLLVASCAQQEQEVVTAERVVAVKALQVQPSDRQLTKTYTGSLEGERQAVLRARLPEAVDKVLVTEGQSVTADQVLATLDRFGPSSQYAQTLSVYQNAKKNFEKMEYLFTEGAVSETQFDAARTEYEVNQAQFDAVSRMVEIHTPIAGRVTSVKVSPGDLVHVGQELATVATTGKLRVKFGVNADDVAFFRTGAEVIVSSEVMSDAATGKIVTVASSADPVSRSFQVEALIDNPNGDYTPGMFVHVDYVLDRLTDVLAVPRDAVLNLDGQETVFVAVDGRAETRRVTLGPDLSGDVVILSGLNPGDTVVTLGQDYLDDGLKLNVTELHEQNR